MVGSCAPTAGGCYAVDVESGFLNGDLVQVDTADINALARVRETNGRRVHLALEVGEYLPWVDEVVMVRSAGAPALLAKKARILHAGNSSALLELAVEEVVPLPYRDGPPSSIESLPFIDDNW